MTHRVLLAALGIVTGLLTVAFALVSRGPAPESGEPSALLDEPWPAPPTALRGLDGTPVRLERFRGRHVAVFFGYTHCPDVCPIALAQMARQQRRLDPNGDDLVTVFITVDPDRDTPERLRAWTEAFGGSVVALTGTVDEVRDAAWAWGVGVTYRNAATGVASQRPPHEDDYLVDHTVRTFIVDPEGRVVAQLSVDPGGEVLGRVLEELL